MNLAYKIGMDPVEFRKKNLTPQNQEAHARQLDVGANAIGWENRNKTPGGGTGVLRRGMGCAIGAWNGGGRGNGVVVTVEIAQNGAVTVSNGAQDLGTGTRTFIRAIVAEELGLDMTDVIERIGNTTYGASVGSGGSTTAASVSPMVKDAAYQARMAISRLLAPLLGTDVDGVWLDKRHVVGGGKGDHLEDRRAAPSRRPACRFAARRSRVRRCRPLWRMEPPLPKWRWTWRPAMSTSPRCATCRMAG